MDGIKLILTLVVVSSTAFMPADAKTSDTPVFDIWLSQWANNAHQITHERLPCLRADKGACSGAFSSSVAGNRAAKRTGAVEPFSHPRHASRSARRQVVFKNANRVETTTAPMGGAFQSMGAVARTSRFLILNDTDNKLLGIDLDEPGETLPSEVETLAGFVGEAEQETPTDDKLLASTAAGVGDSAFVSLYAFEDDSGTGETQRGLQEITSLVGAQSVLASAASVTEPGSLLLIATGLLVALRVRRPCKRERSGQLQLKI